MDILDRTFVTALVALAGCYAGCYAPEVRDCTVSCDAPSHCASDQICGQDHFCVTPTFTGRCMLAAADAGVDAPITDGPTLVPLRVLITGKGAVTIAGHGTCSSQPPQQGNCMFDVTRGVALSAIAIEILPNDQFMRWASATCIGQDERCVFTPLASTSIVAAFGSRRGP
jgi:hypothetical protein